MSYDKNLFYTLDEVKELLFKTGDQKIFKEENIVNLIHTDRLTPYIKYNGLVNIVTEAERASEESINQAIVAWRNSEVLEWLNKLNGDASTFNYNGGQNDDD